MEPTNNSAAGKVIAALIIGLIIGFAAGVFWEKRRLAEPLPFEELGLSDTSASAAGERANGRTGGGEQVSAAGATSTLAAAAAAGRMSVSVADQPAGEKVSVASVKIEKPVWVAVREERNGVPGNILGAQKVTAPGENAPVSVDLLRPTKASGTYFIVLYEDAGSPAFNYQEDVLIPGIQGTFTATE